MAAIRVCADPDDDMFLECAQAAHADYLVTGNLKHFPEFWESTRIVTPRNLLDIIAVKWKLHSRRFTTADPLTLCGVCRETRSYTSQFAFVLWVTCDRWVKAEISRTG